MKGGVKNGAANAAAPAAGSRRAVGTIAEAAAIARAAANPQPAQPNPPRETAKRDRRPHRVSNRALERDGTHDAVSTEDDDAARAEAEDAAPRRDRAAVPTGVEDADSTKAHLILAERAYAYGRSIVEAGPEPKKPGEVEIES